MNAKHRLKRRNRLRPVGKLLSDPLALLALGIMIVVAGSTIWDLIIATRAQTAEAVVLSVRQDTHCNYTSPYTPPHCSPVYLPTVRFTTAQGEHVDAELIDFFDDKSAVNVGSSLKVHYDPLNPDHVQENRWLNANNMWVVHLAILLALYLIYLGIRQVVTSVKKR